MRNAQHIWYNGQIETLDPAMPSAQAFAIGDGRILAVGSDSDILNLQGAGTKVTNLRGRYVMPGLVESHTHALWGAGRDLFDVFVGHQADFEALMQAVRTRVAALPVGTLVSGGPWRLAMRPDMGASPRKVLDAIAPDHPVVLQDITQHSVWCNSAALALAGLTANSPDIKGGVIERDASGAPNGILAENACRPVKALTERTDAQLRQAAGHFVQYFNSLGFTSFKEPMAFEPDLKAYKAADERGELTLHGAAHIVRSSPFAPQGVPYDTMERLRRDYASENMRTDFAKLFLDGVAPSHTASFLDPYLATSGYDAATHDPLATLLIDPEELNETVAELDRRGMVTKMHAVGDYAVRAGLDAIAHARQTNGASGLRHEISHCPFIHPDDLPRFAKLDAVAEVSPKLWFPNAVTAGQIAVLGKDRVQRCHPIRDLLAAGANVTYASDWPAAAPDANPWIGLAGMLDRRDPTGTFPGTVGADQAISLQQALPLFTRNGARALGMETETGTLSQGKWADFVILDRSLHDQSPEEIAQTSVRETFWKGTCVHAR